MKDYAMGEVDLFGLDEFGQPTGNQMVGAAVGAGVQSLAAVTLKHTQAGRPTVYKYAEGIGALVGALAGGAMIAIPSQRGAGWTAVTTSLVSGAVRQVSAMVAKHRTAAENAGAQAADAGGGTAGWGLPTIEPTVAFRGAGLGLPTIEQQALVPGSAGLSDAGVGMPPQLQNAGDYGMGQNPGAQQAQLVGPGFSGLGAHYGATLFGG